MTKIITIKAVPAAANTICKRRFIHSSRAVSPERNNRDSPHRKKVPPTLTGPFFLPRPDLLKPTSCPTRRALLRTQTAAFPVATQAHLLFVFSIQRVPGAIRKSATAVVDKRCSRRSGSISRGWWGHPFR
jgi:hypothetical protein